MITVHNIPWWQDFEMKRPALIFLFLMFSLPRSALPQAEYRIYEDHPRLLLNSQRIDRLRKDATRMSARWRQLKTLIDSEAQFPEQPLVKALQLQVLGDEVAGRQATAWAVESARSGALENAESLRLAALVFDWCYDLFTREERSEMAKALGEAAAPILSARNLEIDVLRGALLAAIAAAGDWVGSEALVKAFFQDHWERWVKSALLRGELLDHGYEIIAVMEVCHAVRNNLDRDLWRETREVFETLPRHLMLGYYPHAIDTAGGVFRYPAFRSTRDFDLVRESTLRRIGEMLLVAYEVNWNDYRFLQGWLRHDAFVLKTPLGAFYEFLWVNPYLPGLSYSSSPLFAYDELRGRLFVRGGWEEDDSWLGYLNGELQVFVDGRRHLVQYTDQKALLSIAETVVVLGRVPMSIDFKAPGSKRIFVVGLGDQQPVRAKVGRKSFEVYQPGRGGILRFENPPKPDKSFLNFRKRIKIEVFPGPWRGSPSGKRKQPTLNPDRNSD